MDYKNGKIYCIRSPNTDKVYIGSTTQPLSKRFYKHKADYSVYKNLGKKNTKSYEIFDCGDAYIELIEEHPCENKMLLNKREGEVMREMDCVNRKLEGRKKQEYGRDNKDYFNKLKREYRARTKKIVICEYCKKEMSNHSINTHIKRFHS